MVKEFVQFLISEVDTKLLKWVPLHSQEEDITWLITWPLTVYLTDLEILKAKDIEHSDELWIVCAWVGASVDLIDQPGEGTRVESLRHCMTILPGLETEKTQEMHNNIIIFKSTLEILISNQSRLLKFTKIHDTPH